MQRILDAQSIAAELERLRAEGKTVVFTNGVFDLLHPGHVRYLTSAKKHGDVLVVALNSDDSVRRLKGPKRPNLPFRERAKIIAALEPVDYVTSFNEDTPLQIITALKPEVLVKGGDYKSGEIVGRDMVEAAGGKVLTLELAEGFSTTEIINRIVASHRRSANS